MNIFRQLVDEIKQDLMPLVYETDHNVQGNEALNRLKETAKERVPQQKMKLTAKELKKIEAEREREKNIQAINEEVNTYARLTGQDIDGISYEMWKINYGK